MGLEPERLPLGGCEPTSDAPHHVAGGEEVKGRRGMGRQVANCASESNKGPCVPRWEVGAAIHRALIEHGLNSVDEAIPPHGVLRNGLLIEKEGRWVGLGNVGHVPKGCDDHCLARRKGGVGGPLGWASCCQSDS